MIAAFMLRCAPHRAHLWPAANAWSDCRPARPVALTTGLPQAFREMHGWGDEAAAPCSANEDLDRRARHARAPAPPVIVA